MKKGFIISRKSALRGAVIPMIALFVAASNLNAAESDKTANDNVYLINEVEINSVRAPKDAPFAVTNISHKELEQFSKTGRELPFLFARAPGIMAWSENGVGTGTTYMRIRGASDSRINVTLDGVPLNSPEDQCVFWANMNSYSALTQDVQIQRGVGSSTNGDGAFGGTVALTTKGPSIKPSAQVIASYGSYNTMNYGASFSTGMMHNGLFIDGGYYQTHTDGFLHGTEGLSGSYYGNITWLGNKYSIRYRNIGNFEKTGQAWNGVTAGNDVSIMDGTYGINTGIKDYADMYHAGLGKFNSLYEYLVTDATGDFVKDVDGNYMTARYTMNDGSYWAKTTDNFWQDHNILTLSTRFSDRLSSSTTLHYTYGYGYYEEFRPDNKLKKFGISNYTLTNGNTLKKTDFVRKKGLSQNAYGIVENIKYNTDNWDINGGLSIQNFKANHFGYLNYIGNTELSDAIMTNGKYTYYDSDADKLDANAFVKAVYQINNTLHAFADIQYRLVNYTTDGINDKFIDNNDGTYSNQSLNIDEQYNFFNPKAGIRYHNGRHEAYASIALSHREPERNNFTDNGTYPAPRAERLTDFETGYSFTGNRLNADINLYYMDYTDQFVQTGAKSDIGEALTTNIKDSYRIGAEITVDYAATRWLTLSANASLSQNRIRDFDEIVEDWDNGTRDIHYDKSTLAFSPSTILNGFAQLHFGGLQLTWHTNYIGRMYLDNTECKDRSLPAYTISNLYTSYNIALNKSFYGLKMVTLGFDMNNIFNVRYAANGWVYSAIYESGGHPNDNRYYQIGFIPMAGLTAMGNITLSF